MKHKKTAVFCALLLSAGMAAGAFSALPRSLSASASVQLNCDDATLFLPTDAEQYLPLKNPSSVAVRADGVVAIADEENLYVYNPVSGSYYCYTHTESGVATKIKQIQFASDGTLYFSSSEMLLFRFNVATKTETVLKNFPCVSFLFAGENLFVVRQSGSEQSPSISFLAEEVVRDVDFDGLNFPMTSVVDEAGNSVFLAANAVTNTLYVAQGNSVSAYNAQTGKFSHSSVLGQNMASPNLTSIAVHGNAVYYTVSAGGKGELYRTHLNGDAVKLLGAEKKLSALTNCNGDLYCIQGKSVQKLSVSEEGAEFSDYEIASASSSKNRLNAATEIERSGNLIVTADAGNSRVSVYDTQSKSYSVIACESIPEHVAIDKDGKRIAVSSSNVITVYEQGANGFVYSYLNRARADVKDITFVYDTCYYITDHGYGYLNADSETPASSEFNGISNAVALTADIYGTLYVQMSNKVFALTEAQFRAQNTIVEIGSEKYTLEGAGTSLTADYSGNVWYLLDDALYCNNELQCSIHGNDFVYYPLDASDVAPVSFALGYEDDLVYFNMGDYVVRSNEGAISNLKTLNKIPTATENGTAADEAFALHEGNLFADIGAGAIGIEVNLEALKEGGTEFKYSNHYYRLSEEMRGVLLAETQGANGYYLIAASEGAGSAVATIFRKSDVTIPEKTGENGYWEDADDVMYVANSVSLTFAPCISSVLTDYTLPRGTKLTVLGYAEGADRVYAFVEAQDGTRATVRGYVPKSYLSPSDPIGASGKTYTVGFLKGTANVVLEADDGERITVIEKTEAEIHDNGDGTYTVVANINGKLYRGLVKNDAIIRGENDALRISLIVILSVLALVIIGAYVYLMFPRKTKK